MADVPTLFVRLAELAIAETDAKAGIDGVWTTTIEAATHDHDWQVALNCDTETEHTIADVPREGDHTSLRPASATVWLGTRPAGVCTPNGGSLVVQATISGPERIEDALIADIEARIEDLAATPTGGESG